MVKFPPGGRARGPGGRFRGPEAEPEVQPLIAQLKQDREDSRAEVNECVDQVITELTSKISERIISKNRLMQLTHSEPLSFPTTASLNGIIIDCQLFLTGIDQWAENNGIRVVVEEVAFNDLREKYWINAKLSLKHSNSHPRCSTQNRVFEISFHWGDE
ncbi:MAG TPA: hypothetical protein EYQ15_04480 [Candidatus Poseidoniales archaeon]|nr:hypothetical protein [Candidatus Poseidoniales archaeon]HIL44379.1 hypothetical protein [Candidatus Poseidoniales archaeon]